MKFRRLAASQCTGRAKGYPSVCGPHKTVPHHQQKCSCRVCMYILLLSLCVFVFRYDRESSLTLNIKVITGELSMYSLPMKKIERINARNLGLYTFIYIGVTSRENFPEDGNIAGLLNTIYFYPDNGQNSKTVLLQRYQINVTNF
jgi:hypothetical protein